MDLSRLSKQERFFFDVGEGMSLSNTRCFINVDTLEVILYVPEDYNWEDEEDENEEVEIEEEEKFDFDDPEKFMFIEPVTSHEAFRIMEQFADSVANKHMQQRLIDALSGRKPFANFNHLVHTTEIREQWFHFKNRTYTHLAKEWIEHKADKGLKKKIRALPAVRLAE